jgi:predicted alpha/beta-hydrolase family hydrolase
MLALGLFVRWLCAFPDAASAQQEIVTLPTRPGVTQSYFLTRIPKDLRAVAVLGLLQLRNEDGKIRFSMDNFLVRSRSEFIKRNGVAAILDAPSDQQRNCGMTDEFRRGELHLTDISIVVDDLGKRFPSKPIFLVGTSRGSVSAAALGARFGQKIAGVVLTSSMFRAASSKSNEPGPGLSRFDFATIKVPTLFVHHVSDQCETTPYSDAARLSDQFPLITVFDGDSAQSKPCDPFSAHGFFKREAETVEQIVNWMLKKEYREEIK